MSDDDPLTEADVGESVEIREEQRHNIHDSFTAAAYGGDREAENFRISNVRLEESGSGAPVLVWEQAADVTRTISKRDYEQMQAKREYEQHKRQQKRQHKKRRSNIVSTLLGGGLAVGIAAFVMYSFPSMTINGETVSVGEFAGPMIFVVLLVVFIGLALPYLPGKVMQS